MMTATEWRQAWTAAVAATQTVGEEIPVSALAGAEYDPDGAVPTSRCLPEPYRKHSEYRQEAILADGRAVAVYWLFSPDDIDDACDADGYLDDESRLPFDPEHVDRVATCE